MNVGLDNSQKSLLLTFTISMSHQRDHSETNQVRVGILIEAG